MSNEQFYDKEAEGQVLGSALLGRIENVEPSDFHNRLYSDTFATIRSMQLAKEPITLETVLAKLDPNDVYHTELVGLAAQAATLAAPEYARRIRESARKRGLMAAMSEAAKGLHKDMPLDAIIAQLTASSLKQARGDVGAQRVSAKGLLDEFLDAVAEPRQTWGLASGIGPIDLNLGGIHTGETMLIAGDPAVGKSIFTTQLGFQLAGIDFGGFAKVTNAYPGAMYHLEMSKEAVLRRAACARARVDYRKVRTGSLDEQEQKRYTDALGILDRAPVFISDRTDWTTTSLQADIARLIEEEGIKWVVVDYAGLLKNPAQSLLEKEMSISIALHDIAKMGVAMIVVETLNKAGMRGDRDLSGVRGSVQKTYDADVVAFLEFPRDAEDKKTPERDLRFTKAREADAFQVIPLTLFGSHKRFTARAQSKFDKSIPF